MRHDSPPIDGFVQICPNDGPPFLDLCRVYAKAAEGLGLGCTTVFLSSSRLHRAPANGCYLDAPELRRTHRVAARLRERLPEVGNSLVLCHRYRSYWVFARSGLRARRVIALAHEHGFFKRWGRHLARRLFAREVSFAGVSPTLVAELESTVGTALHLPNALDLEALAWSDRAAARRALGLPDDGVCIGVIGRLHYKKNPALALEAFRVYAARHGPAHLGFIGDGALRQRLVAQAVGMPVTFTGFVRDAKLLMRAFDAVLLTATAQAFPIMVALEAMAAGVPVAAPRLPDAVSVLGNLGCYFDRPDAESIAAALREAVIAGPLPDGLERAASRFSVAAVAARLNTHFLGKNHMTT